MSLGSLTALLNLLKDARSIWGTAYKMTPEEIGVAMGVVTGDVCRAIRDGNKQELTREMGNMLLSSVRWCDDMGIDIREALDRVAVSQRAFVKNRGIR